MKQNLPKRINSFKDLRCWQLAHQLALVIYKTTKTFPKEELFGLTNQLRRAIVSVTSNIAEGFSRKGKQEKIQFLYIALASLAEVESQVELAKDLQYLKQSSHKHILLLIQETGKTTNGLINSLKRN